MVQENDEESLAIYPGKPGSRIDQILAILAFLSMIVAIWVIAATPPAATYEISIYDAYPWYFWLLLCVSIACGISILIHRALAKEKSSWWLAGLLAIILSNAVILLLPFFRGYALFGRDDVLSHLGFTVDILSTGKLSGINFYPVSHILAANLSQVLGVDPKTIIDCLPAFFNLVYILGVYSLATAMSKDRGQVLLITAFGTVLLFSYYGSMFLPTHFAFSITPLILFLFLRTFRHATRSISNTIVLLILLLLAPFFHPLACIQVLVVFLVFELSIVVWNLFRRRSEGQSQLQLSQQGASFTPALMVFITFFVWFSSFAEFGIDVREISDWLERGVGTVPVEAYGSTMARAGTSISEFLYMLFRGYGHELLCAGVATIAILVIMRRAYLRRSSPRIEQTYFALLFLVFSLLFFPFLFGAFLFTNPMREYEWGLMAASVMSGIFLYEWVSNKLEHHKGQGKGWLGKSMVVGVLVVVLLTSAVVGVFSAYYSPLTGLMNSQVTHAELRGMQWYLDERDPEAYMSYVGELGGRSVPALIGHEARDSRRIIYYPAPDHFGYEDGGGLAPALSSGAYLVITQYDKTYYREVWPEGGRFSISDFERLHQEQALAKVYSNGQLEIWQSLRNL